MFKKTEKKMHIRCAYALCIDIHQAKERTRITGAPQRHLNTPQRQVWEGSFAQFSPVLSPLNSGSYNIDCQY